MGIIKRIICIFILNLMQFCLCYFYLSFDNIDLKRFWIILFTMLFIFQLILGDKKKTIYIRLNSFFFYRNNKFYNTLYFYMA